ncbi:hypothetical protein SCOR_23450 [Sulfidibacter corallicola]
MRSGVSVGLLAFGTGCDDALTKCRVFVGFAPPLTSVSTELIST